jgi:hypothetical protein
MAGRTAAAAQGAAAGAAGGPAGAAAGAAVGATGAGAGSPKKSTPGNGKTTGFQGEQPKQTQGIRGSGRAAASRGRKWAWAGNRKLLAAEWLVCIVVLGLGTLLTPMEGDGDSVKKEMGRVMIKGSALCAVFFLLALVASGGTGPAKVATGLGTLITAAYLLTSEDVHNVASWTASFFTHPAEAEHASGKVEL